MHRFLFLFAAAILAACVAVPPGAPAGSRSTSGFGPVLCVEHVEVAVLESHPVQLVVTARGLTRTAGWTAPALEPNPNAPAGTLELVFLARPPAPGAMVAQMLAPVEARWTGSFAGPLPQAVEVVAETNRQRVPLGGPATPAGC